MGPRSTLESRTRSAVWTKFRDHGGCPSQSPRTHQLDVVFSRCPLERQLADWKTKIKVKHKLKVSTGVTVVVTGFMLSRT